MTQVTMMGNPIEVSGNFPKKGEKVMRRVGLAVLMLVTAVTIATGE